ncbi:signal recognition particle subunit SRP68 [Achaetomium macrosporum]|uniref:Signal recognition particle subunit SRP68 n=1 Tax=Achaetomium macrosporum TaxID=79813 RepID=A0AAN7C425_9PEZI|nr:signal recognition particle subunit SRP68 [Achaetomium macrosporum]
MDITKSVISLREKALLYGDYSTYRSQLSGKLLNCRKKLNIATKNRGKFHPRAPVTPEQIAENHEYVYLQLLTAERAWAHAMSMKASHSADTKGVTSKARSHIVSRLGKAARTAEGLSEALSSPASGASPTDVLDARAYASLLRGAALFERQSWEPCLKSYAVCRIIYSALATSAKGDVFKDLLSETIDPSIRYAAYQAKIPRTQPIAAIARKAFDHADPQLVDRVKSVNPAVLEHGDPDARKGAEGAPTALVWRGREVKIEDATIAIAWAAVGTARSQLAEKLASAGSLHPKDMAGAYDEILNASQDAVDATKQAIDELRAEGVTQGDPRMQSLQITRTAVNYEMISWRIGRNRVLVGGSDGAKLEFGVPARRKRQAEESTAGRSKDEAPGRQIARLKEKVVLYDGILQSLESIKELPGVANDQDLSGRLDATSQYFTALKCLAIARSHAIAGNAVNSLALIKHALDQCKAAIPALSSQDEEDDFAPRNIQVTKRDVSLLHDTLTGELQRGRALVEIFNLNKATNTSQSTTTGPAKPLSSRLSDYPSGGVDLDNIVVYPPRLEPFPVKPLFLDVAWNYIEYPNKREEAGVKEAASAQEQAAPEAGAKPQKRGWFGFGR